MKYLKALLYLLLIPVGIFLFILLWGTLSDYRPGERTGLYEDPGAPLLKDSSFNIMIWNIGYCGLGKEMDFFYDGGRDVRPAKAESVSNLAAVINFLETLDSCDFFLLQEVDIRSKRSYRINQLDSIEAALCPRHTSFGKNFDVFFNPVPPRAPLGKLQSGIASLSRRSPLSSVRHSFPGNYGWPKGVFMLDRCFLVDRYPLAGGKDLLIINTHNSAYDDGSLRKGQMDYLHSFLVKEYALGNYLVVGGDWNQTPSGFQSRFEEDVFDTIQLSYVEKDYLPANWTWLFDPSIPTNRRVDKPYTAGISRTTVIDFFLLSPNLEPLYVRGIDLDFSPSDHQPVLAGFSLR